MTEAAKAKGQRELAFSQTTKSKRTLTRSNVLKADRSVNNCVQHLLIAFGTDTLPERFTAESYRVQARQPYAVLGHVHYLAVGRSFEPLAHRHLVAWCEPPLSRRTARSHCLFELVERLRGWQ